jgi:hypothetical protein
MPMFEFLLAVDTASGSGDGRGRRRLARAPATGVWLRRPASGLRTARGASLQQRDGQVALRRRGRGRVRCGGVALTGTISLARSGGFSSLVERLSRCDRRANIPGLGAPAPHSTPPELHAARDPEPDRAARAPSGSRR